MGVHGQVTTRQKTEVDQSSSHAILRDVEGTRMILHASQVNVKHMHSR